MSTAKKGYPSRGELVLGTVKKINPFSIFVELDEYTGKEGMVHIGEVARKWIKDIRDFAKVGQKVVALVLRIDESKGHISLSLKRVDKRRADEKKKEVKREQKAERLLELVAKDMKVPFDKLNESLGEQLREGFGELFKPFRLALTPEGIASLEKRGIEKKWVKAIVSVSENNMELKELVLKNEVELWTLGYDGIEKIKKVLEDAGKKYEISVHYISAPKYSFELVTKNAKKGEKKLKEAAEFAVKKMKALGGDGKVLDK